MMTFYIIQKEINYILGEDNDVFVRIKRIKIPK
jgi:hypothetical protein